MFITLRFKILPKNNKDKQTILNLMRAYSSCHRFVYKRLSENYKENEIYKLAREKFKDLPTWFILRGRSLLAEKWAFLSRRLIFRVGGKIK